MQGMRQLYNRIGNMLARGVVRTVNAAGKMQILQLGMLAGETKDRLEHVEPYGFTSHPKSGAEAVAVFLDGDRGHGLVLVVADRRFRLAGLAAGEMAIHDDQGQKVHLTRTGIVVDGGGLPIIIQNAPTVTADTPEMICTGNLTVQQHLTYQGGMTGSGGAGAAITGGLQLTGGAVSHNGKNIGSTHTHGGIAAGAANTAGPNP